MTKFLEAKTVIPLLRPGLKNTQLNYWLRSSFPKLLDPNGLVIKSKYYSSFTPLTPLEDKAKIVSLIDHSEEYPDFTVATAGIIYLQKYENYQTELPIAVLSCLGEPLRIKETLEWFEWNQKVYSPSNKQEFEDIFFNEIFVSSVGSVTLKKTDLSFIPLNTKVNAVVFDTDNQTITIENDYWDNLQHKKCMVLVKQPLETYTVNTYPEFIEGGLVEIPRASSNFVMKTIEFVRLVSNFEALSCISPITEEEEKATRTLLVEFFKTLQHYPTKIFKDAKYKQLLLERASKFCTYWGGLAEILDFTEITEPDLPDIDFIKAAENSPTRLTTKQLASLAAESEAFDSNEGRVFLRVSNAYTEAAKEAEELAVKFAPFKRKVDSLQKVLDNLSKKISTLEDCIATYSEALETQLESQKETAALFEVSKQSSDLLKSKLESSKQNLDRRLQEIRDNILTNDSNFFENKLAKMNVIVTSAILRNKETKEELPLVGNEDLCNESNWYLGGLTFVTTRPHVIRVNAEKHGRNAPEVVGGPYEVTLSYFYNPETRKFNKPQMFLKLASVDSVFGRFRNGQEWKAKIHPHTQASLLRANSKSISMFVANAHNVCLGEAEGLLTNGFNTKDIFIVIATVLSWIGSANTQDLANANANDEFGMTWTWFPKKSEVSLNGGWNIPQPQLELEQEVKTEDMENTRWEAIKAKLQGAGLPVPNRAKKIDHNNTICAANYTATENNENNSTN